MMKTSLYPFYSLSLDDLKTRGREEGLPTFSSDQVYGWIYKRKSFEPHRWSNVGKKAKDFISKHFDLTLPKIVWHGRSKDGTRKFLVELNDEQTVEMVLIPAEGRLTLCLSTQVGCAIGCTFCHTGTMGYKRHLLAGEIVGQFLRARKWLDDHGGSEQITNIVYMGQGEPLHNFDNVKKATIIFMEAKGLALGQRKITLSTSGLIPQIEKLADFPPINIAVSLHATRDSLRSELIPINKTYGLKRLFMALGKIPLKAHRRITYEYLLIDGLNDGLEDIEGLDKWPDKRKSKINLIPFNEYPGSRFKRPSQEHIKWFQDQLLKRGHICMTRPTKGQDILAACGQLKSYTLAERPPIPSPPL